MEKPFFLRQKEVRIVRLADDRYRLDGEMRDDFHVIRASPTIEYPSMTVVRAEGEMVRGTNPPFCGGATQVLGGLLGERIHRGFTKVAADSCWVFTTAADERFDKQWREQP